MLNRAELLENLRRSIAQTGGMIDRNLFTGDNPLCGVVLHDNLAAIDRYLTQRVKQRGRDDLPPIFGPVIMRVPCASCAHCGQGFPQALGRREA